MNCVEWNDKELNVMCFGESGCNRVYRLKVLLHSVRDTIRPTRFAEDVVVVRSTFRRAVVDLVVTPMLR